MLRFFKKLLLLVHLDPKRKLMSSLLEKTWQEHTKRQTHTRMKFQIYGNMAQKNCYYYKEVHFIYKLKK